MKKKRKNKIILFLINALIISFYYYNEKTSMSIIFSNECFKNFTSYPLGYKHN